MLQVLMCKLNIRHEWHTEHPRTGAYTSAVCDAARMTINVAEGEGTSAGG